MVSEKDKIYFEIAGAIAQLFKNSVWTQRNHFKWLRYSNNEIRLSRNRLFDIRQIVKFTKENVPLIRSIGLDEFLSKANKLPLRHRNLKEYPFKSIFQFSQYLCGYRAYLISMVDTNCLQTSFQKELQRLIRKIEAQILLLEQALPIRNSN